MIDMKELGLNIQMQRKLKGLNQEELAEKANISLDTLKKIEQGKLNTTFNTLNKIVKALNLHFKYRLEK